MAITVVAMATTAITVVAIMPIVEAMAMLVSKAMELPVKAASADVSSSHVADTVIIITVVSVNVPVAMIPMPSTV